MTTSDENARDRMIKHGFYIGLGLATVCLIFASTYISWYSERMEDSFEGHVPAFLKATDTRPLVCIMLTRTALNKTLLQSCGVVGGIAFGFVGFALFLLGVRGNIDAEMSTGRNTFTFKRLAPGSAVILAALLLVGISANHGIGLELGTGGNLDAISGATRPNAENPNRDIGPSSTWKALYSLP
jgi:hypothetical protein